MLSDSWQVFDTFSSRGNTDMLVQYLQAQPDGTIVMVITADEPTGADGFQDKVAGAGTYLHDAEVYFREMGVDLHGKTLTI